MATKNNGRGTGAGETLEIDREAYDRLQRARGEDETFSEVIKRCVRPRQSREQILRTMRRARISISTLQMIDESATRRRKAAHQLKD